MSFLRWFKRDYRVYVDKSFEGHWVKVNNWLYAKLLSNGDFEVKALVNTSKKDRYCALISDTHHTDVIQVPDKGDMVKLTRMYNDCERFVHYSSDEELKQYYREQIQVLEKFMTKITAKKSRKLWKKW